MSTKEFYNQLCYEYQQVLTMSEAEVQERYEEYKSQCMAAYECEIDYWAEILGY